MSSTQFIHVAEFFETIFCFSILVLLGQRIVRIWKKLDDKYAQAQVKLYKDEQIWTERKIKQHASENREGNDLDKAQQQYQPSQTYKQNQKIQPPKEDTLRASLVDVEQEKTDREKAAEHPDLEVKEPKRKSLTDLMRQQQRNSREIQITDEPSSRKHSINSNVNSQDMKEKTPQQQKKKSIGLDRLQSMDVGNEEPITQNSEQREQIKTEFKLHVITQIDKIFSEHVPVLVSLLIVGILVNSTYIFTIVCFFGYIFSHLVLVTLLSASPVRNEASGQTISQKLGLIVPKLWIFALFISYWSDSQFS